MWIFGESEEDVCEEGGGSVASSYKDIEEFGADRGDGGGLGQELVEEDVAVVGGVGCF